MSATAEPTALLRTPFFDSHVKYGAKLVDFAGWEMPIHYGSIIEEHKQVRSSGGFFDVSHMGRLHFSGRDARRFLDLVCTRQIFGMKKGQVRYSIICNERGGCRDDVLVYCYDEGDYLMVCNASNRMKLLRHFDEVRGDMVFKLDDQTTSTAMCAVQGPKVMDMVSSFSSEIPNLKRYNFTHKNLMLFKVLVSRTGYTGEDGVEVILPAKMVGTAMKLMLRDVGDDNAIVKPTGLGARDSLRLEAAMALYGHEITEEIDPVSAGLNFAIKLDKGDENEEVGHFIGQDVLKKIAAEGPRRKLIGLRLEGKRSARQDMPVRKGDDVIGAVTSGCVSPTFGYPIAMAYVEAPHSEQGNVLQVDLGRTTVEAEVVPLPFYKAG